MKGAGLALALGALVLVGTASAGASSSGADDELDRIRSINPEYADHVEDLIRIGKSDALNALANGLDAGGYPALADRARTVAREREASGTPQTPTDQQPPIDRPVPEEATPIEEIKRGTQDPRIFSLRNALNARLVPRGYVPIQPGDTLDGATCGAMATLVAAGLESFSVPEIERVFRVRLDCSAAPLAPTKDDRSSNVAERWMIAVGSADVSTMKDQAIAIAKDPNIKQQRAVWAASLGAIAAELQTGIRAVYS